MIIYNFIKFLVIYLRYYRVLKGVYTEDNFMQNLSKTLGVEVDMDNIGRLYCIFNPNLIDGKFDPNNPIYSYGANGMNTDEFVRQFMMTKLSIAQRFIKATNLFDLVTYDMKKLDNYDNYLFIIKPVPYDDFIKWFKLLPIPIVILIAIIIILIVLL